MIFEMLISGKFAAIAGAVIVGDDDEFPHGINWFSVEDQVDDAVRAGSCSTTCQPSKACQVLSEAELRA
ncbi:MAG: hypothetical protein EOR78_27790 [Mesorhizobium sp.]|nr:MAG: hypothetical protein EOR49_22665 [Mesorhizobium sp.]RWM49458.1 MAG: hypothetical protein EOR78_27790 [Mesorhizobium sp.]RWM53696.1 MAG: hypothetical protein EOR76_00300 [Mesorhizobium sp.]RWM54038.1 MAG: hypothetical protein EOR79_25065 [Mesorhizobium sp.]RWM93917.1 MAG: hypothetical protein EOR85_26610 [Mesorhizobium sp.]